MQGPALLAAFAALCAASVAPPPPPPAPSPLLDRARYSLWQGAPAPVALPASMDPSAAEDEASALASRRFDGTQLRDAVASLPGAGLAAGTVRLSALAPRKPGDLFVSVELALASKPDQLKDAVAQLGQSAAFRPDARFQPDWLGAAKDRVAVWGWMPGARLGTAAGIPGVSRISVAREKLLPPADPARGEFVVGIRVRSGDPTPVAQLFSRVLRDLARQADFQWRRTIGYQAVPGSRDLALVVVGEAPLRKLGPLMAHPDVVKVLPSPDGPLAGRGAQPPPRQGFLAYVLGHAPLLVLLTGLLLLSTWRGRSA